MHKPPNQDLFNRYRNVNERIHDEAAHHHASAVAMLKRFPEPLFEPGGQFHHPELWEEYLSWRELLACTDRLDFQTYWRFEDWDKRCRSFLRRARWSQGKFDFSSRFGQQDPSFKRALGGTEAIRVHFKTLGLSPVASNDEIKSAYRRLAVEHHPDKEGGDTGRMQQINVAYNELRRIRRF